MNAQTESGKSKMELVSRLEDLEMDRDLAASEFDIVEAKIEKAETRRDKVKAEIFQKVVSGYIEKRDELKERIDRFDYQVADIKKELEEIRIAEEEEQKRREEEERNRREAEERADIEKRLTWLGEKKEQILKQMLEPSDTIEEMAFRKEMEEFETEDEFKAAVAPAFSRLEELKVEQSQIDHKIAKHAQRLTELGGEVPVDIGEMRDYGEASMGTLDNEVSPIDESEVDEDEGDVYDPLQDTEEERLEEESAPSEPEFDPNLAETKPYEAVEEELSEETPPAHEMQPVEDETVEEEELYEPEEVFEPEEIIEDEVEVTPEPEPVSEPDPMAETIKAPVYTEPEEIIEDEVEEPSEPKPMAETVKAPVYSEPEGGDAGDDEDRAVEDTMEEEIVGTPGETEVDTETEEIDEEVISEEVIEDEESIIEAASDAASMAVSEAIEDAIAPLSEEDKEFFGDMEEESVVDEQEDVSEQERQFFADAGGASVVINPSIVMQDPSGKQQIFELVHDIMIIGSAGLGDVDIHIPHPSVDKKHARIKLERGRYVIKDLRSKNGTFINGKKVRKGRLNHMDKLKFGDIFFQVRLP